MRDSSVLRVRWVMITPHVIDTFLLSSAIVMVIWSHQYPIEQPWLTAKLLALVCYILFAIIALKNGAAKSVRVGAFVGALLAFSYIGAAAITKHVLIWM